jgi:hypothetical protein
MIFDLKNISYLMVPGPANSTVTLWYQSIATTIDPSRELAPWVIPALLKEFRPTHSMPLANLSREACPTPSFPTVPA